MATELVHVGHGNYVSANKIVSIATPGSGPVRRLVQEAKNRNMAVDMTGGRKTKAVVFMDNGSVVLAAVTPGTIDRRLRHARDRGAAEEEEA